MAQGKRTLFQFRLELKISDLAILALNTFRSLAPHHTTPHHNMSTASTYSADVSKKSRFLNLSRRYVDTVNTTMPLPYRQQARHAGRACDIQGLMQTQPSRS